VRVALAHVLAADEVRDVPRGGMQAALEGRDRALRGRPRPDLGQAVFLPLVAVRQRLDERVEAVDPPALDLDPGIARVPHLGGARAELRLDAIDDEAELARGVLGLGEQEAQEPLGAELAHGPEEGLHALAAAAGGRQALGRVLAHRRQDLDRGERLRGQAHLLVGRAVVGRQPAVLLVEKEQVLALHVEDEGVRVRRFPAERTGGEEAVKQEGRVARLRRDARDARDADVGAARAVEEVEVREDGLAVA
jgi:hypothetical protein